MELQTRIDELRAMPWQEVKAIASALDLTKPKDKSWDEFAEDIAIAESVAATEIEIPESLIEEDGEAIAESTDEDDDLNPPGGFEAFAALVDEIESQDEDIDGEPPQESSAEAIAPIDQPVWTPKGTYATEYFKANGIPYCQKCGAQLQTSMDGDRICAESLPESECPILSN